MAESFGVDVCYQEPCHFVPPQSLSEGLDAAIKVEPTGNEPIPGAAYLNLGSNEAVAAIDWKTGTYRA